METFIKIFTDCGSGGEKRLENLINAFAKNKNLDIVSANLCFRKGFIDSDTMFSIVVFKKKGE